MSPGIYKNMLLIKTSPEWWVITLLSLIIKFVLIASKTETFYFVEWNYVISLTYWTLDFKTCMLLQTTQSKASSSYTGFSATNVSLYLWIGRRGNSHREPIHRFLQKERMFNYEKKCWQSIKNCGMYIHWTGSCFYVLGYIHIIMFRRFIKQKECAKIRGHDHRIYSLVWVQLCVMPSAFKQFGY